MYHKGAANSDLLAAPLSLLEKEEEMSDSVTRALEAFNNRAYRDALLAFEERWFTERNDFWKALIRLSNALMQLELGLVTAPRLALASAEEMLAAYEPFYEGFDVTALRAYIARVRTVIPDQLETGSGSVAWEDVPHLALMRAVQQA